MLLKEGGYYVLKFFDRYDFALVTYCDCIIPMNFSVMLFYIFVFYWQI
jgi:hypothetical protein